MGEAVRQSGIPRNEVFLTTKILSAGGSAEKTYKKCLDSVHKIDGENGYVDLFLIHTSSGGPAAVKEMYQALEKLESEGKVRSIGVSNFGVGHIESMKSYARIWPPHVNQIEVPTPLSSSHWSSQTESSSSRCSELHCCNLPVSPSLRIFFSVPHPSSISTSTSTSTFSLISTSTSAIQTLTSHLLTASPVEPTTNDSGLL